jgi:hypothetical protein
MIELLNSIAQRCDGVRCDMAMLALSDVFAKTWEGWPTGDANPAPPPVATHAVPTKTPAPGEFWSTATTDVKQSQPDFEFLAEAYWGLEDRLRALGFNYAYDKTLYDGLVNRDAGGVQDHLLGLSTETLAAGAHFLENHDEKRVASILSPAEHAAAALVILGLPGMRFLYEGQLTGARLKIPVQLGLAPAEPAQPAIARIYEQLLTTLPGTAVGRGRGELLTPRSAWPGNPTARNFIVVQWQSQPLEFDVVVVNLASHRSQCYAPLTVGQLTKHNWAMRDLLGQEHHKRSGNDLQNQGLYLDLSAHAAQLFHFEPSN